MLLIAKKDWSIALLVIWILAATIIIIYMSRGSNHRTLLEYSSFITSIVAVIYYIVTLVTMNLDSNKPTNSPAPSMLFLYSVYTSFAFMPGLIALRRISLEKKKQIGVFAAYLGVIWTFVLIITGVVLAVLEGVHKNMYSSPAVIFLMYGYFGFIPFILLLIRMQPTRSIIVYSILLILTMVCDLIIYFPTFYSFFTFFLISFIFVDLPVIGAVLCVAIYGYSWKGEVLNENKFEAPVSQEV